MEVNEELIKKVAKNARLKLSDSEIKEFVPQFKEILDLFSELAKVDTKDVKPSFHPIDIKNNMREDKILKSLSQEEALANVKFQKDGYIKGPKVV